MINKTAHPAQLGRMLLSACCAAVVGVYLVATWHWPLMGDSGLIHYVVFLLHHGWAPYRDILEINTPAAYLTESWAMRLFGGGAYGWRIFDFSLLLIAGACYCITSGENRWTCGPFAATLFLVIHGQDGVMVAGERDLVVAVLLFASVSVLIHSAQKRSDPNQALCAASGALAGWAICIKPTTIFFAPAVWIWLWWSKRQRQETQPSTAIHLLGFLIFPIISIVYLAAQGAVQSYFGVIRGIAAYHLSLAHRPLTYLFVHSLSPLEPLLVLAAVYILVNRDWRFDKIDILLSLSSLCGLASYFIQGKGFSYQRYPFILFLLAFCIRKIFSSHAIGRLPSALRCITIALCMWLSINGLHKLLTYSHVDPDLPLIADLHSLGADAAPASVQCFDTIGPCIETLYKLQIVQSTGFFYDCYFADGSSRLVMEQRRRFYESMLATRPQWIVVTNSLCFARTPTFHKYAEWPEMDALIETSYSMVREHNPTKPVRYWSRPETPVGYRIYRRLP